MKTLYALSLLILAFSSASVISAQSNSSAYYLQKTEWSGFVEYSNDSSHIILGRADNRKLTAVGGTYARRALATPAVVVQYMIEIRPVVFETDPVETSSAVLISGTLPPGLNGTTRLERASDCVAFVNKRFDFVGYPAPGDNAFDLTQSCSTYVTYAAGLSPLGVKINLVPKNRWEPFIVGNAGFLVSSRDIPAQASSNFNFTFEFGGGVEWFHRSRRSISLEYRIHHLSNHNIGFSNPGIDSGIFKASYSFGR